MTTAPSGAAIPEGAIWLPGLHVALVPPDGWEPALDFVGFVHVESGSSLVVAELPVDAATMVSGMTEEALAGEGIAVSTLEREQIQGRDALLVEGTQAVPNVGEFGKVLLVTGDEVLTVLLTGNYPVGEDAEREALLASVRSAVVDSGRSTDARDALSFTLEPAPPLKFAGAVANGAIYNEAGNLDSAGEISVTLIVTPSLAPVSITDVEAFARQRLETFTQVADIEVESTEEVEVAGLSGVEIVGTGTWTAGSTGDVVIHQLLLIQPDRGYVLMVGIAPVAERDEALALFRESAMTYRPRDQEEAG